MYFFYIPKKTYLLPFLIAVYVLAFPTELCSQNILTFKVIHLPRKAGYSKEKLNEEIAGLKDKNSVARIIRQKNFTSLDIIFQVKHNNESYSWWTFNPSNGLEKETQDIILQSKTGQGEKKETAFEIMHPTIKQPADFKDILKNSLFLFDTLFFNIQIDNKQYPHDQFCFYFACSNGEIKKENIPIYNGMLVISENLFQTCPLDDFITISLYNTKKNQERLSHCYIRFLTVYEKDALLDLALSYKNTRPDLDISVLADFLTSYFEEGSPWRPQLLRWLETSLYEK